MRIVSLIPSSTEIVCALGRQDQLVGRSHECDYPVGIGSLPVCCEPKFKTGGTSREIDDAVQKLVRESLSVYRVKADKLKELRPDVIVTQDHCEVCAVSVKDVKNAVCEWLGSRPKIVTLKAAGLEQVWQGFQSVADACGCSEEGKKLVESCRKRMQTIAAKAKGIRQPPSAACIEWFDPLMMAGNWVPELLAMLGVKDPFGIPGEHAPRTTWEALLAKNPEYILLMPCGWSIKKSRQELGNLLKHPEWEKLDAVKTGRVYVTEGNQYFNRPGPRLVDSLEILAEIFYPEHFSFGHEGSGWQKL